MTDYLFDITDLPLAERERILSELRAEFAEMRSLTSSRNVLAEPCRDCRLASEPPSIFNLRN